MMDKQFNAKQNRMNILKSCIITIGFLSTCVYAEKYGYWGRTPNTFWSILFENDFFAQSGDRYYTHGTQISCMVLGEGPEWLEAFADFCPLYSKSREQAVNYKLGHTIFTPQNTRAVTLCKDDRPYAGYLFASTALVSNFKVNEIIDCGNILELTVGVLGPVTRAKEAQIWFHKRIGNDIPRGWDNQLHNELGIDVSYSRIWALVQPISNKLEISIDPRMSCMIGNVYTYSGGGVMFRFGKNVRSKLSPPNIPPCSPGISFYSHGHMKSWYFYLGSESRLMIRNIFLDGNTFQDSHSVSKEFIVWDFQFGFVYHYRNMIFAISNMIRSREFIDQSEFNRYGSVSISWYY